MLGTRVITALVLVALLVPVLFFAPAQIGAWVALGVMALTLWEWNRLLGLTNIRAALWSLAFVIIALAIDALHISEVVLLVLALAVGFWCVVVPWWFKRGLPQRWWTARWPLMALGWLLLGASWWAIDAALRRGPVYLLSIFVIVWVSDVAAYFAGRTWGRHKLAPTISPGKTWEGVAGAIAGVLVLGGAVLKFNAQMPTVPTFLGAIQTHASVPALACVLVGLTVLGIIGDLFESQLKRKAGVKDSSRLLPGHGGVFDRVDAILPVLPAAVLIERLLNGLGWN